MRRLRIFASTTFWLPMAAMLVFSACFFLYYSHLKSAREKAFDRAALRALSSVALQFEDLVDNATNVVEHLAVAPPHQEFLKPDPAILQIDDARCPLSSEKQSLTVTSEVVAIRFGGASQCATIPLHTTLIPLITSLTPQIFDDVVLTDSNGSVLYQTHATGVTISSIPPPDADSIWKNEATSTNQTSETGKPRDAVHKVIGTERNAYIGSRLVISTGIGADRYRVYAVPVSLRLIASQPDLSTAQTTFREEQLFAFGLVLDSSYFDRTRPVPDAVLIALIILVFLVTIGTWPLLKFLTLQPADRISKKAGLLFALSFSATVILFIVFVLHIRFVLHDPKVDQHLEDLAAAIDSHLTKEVRRTLQVTRSVGTTFSEGRPPALMTTADLSACNFKQTTLPEYTKLSLLSTPVRLMNPYPYLARIYGFDTAGYEHLQWSIYDRLAATARVCDRPYFIAIQSTQLWFLRDERHPSGSSVESFRIDPLYSLQTGQYLSVISQSPQYDRWSGAPGWLNMIMVATPLLSLNKPVTPPDYGFAVLDANGKVLFHSDASQNSRANFFDEVNNPDDLRAAIATHRNLLIDASYEGAATRIYISYFTAFSGSPWTLVTFSTDASGVNRRLERMLLFASLTVVYYCLVIIPCAVVLAMLPRHIRASFWPSHYNSGLYIQLSIGLIIIAAVFYSFIFRLPSPSLIIFSACTTVLCCVLCAASVCRARRLFQRLGAGLMVASCAALVGQLVWLIHLNNGQGLYWQLFHARRPQLVTAAGMLFIAMATVIIGSSNISEYLNRVSHVSLSTSYTLAAGLLLLITAALPTLLMFKLSYDHCELNTVIEDEWRTAALIDQRMNAIRQFYRDVDFGSSGISSLRRWTFLRRRIREENLDLYDNSFGDRNAGQLFEPAYAHDKGCDERFILSFPLFFWELWHQPGSFSHFLDIGESSQSSWRCGRDSDYRVHLYRNETDTYDPNDQGTSAPAQLSAVDRALNAHQLFADVRPLDPATLFSVSGRIVPTILFLFGFMTLGFMLLREVLRRMLLLNVTLPAVCAPSSAKSFDQALQLSLAEVVKGKKNLILIGAPCSSKSHSIATHCGKVTVMDVSSLQDYPPCMASEEQPVVIDHFETGLHTPEKRSCLLTLLESLLFDIGSHIIIVSIVEPASFLSSLLDSAITLPPAQAPISHMEYARWLRVLRRFEPTLYVAPHVPISADGYYFIFMASSPLEQIALQRLCDGDWPNYRNYSAFLHLSERGVVIFDPAPRLYAPQFASLIRSRLFKDPVEAADSDHRNEMWDGVRLSYIVTLLLLLAALFFLKDHDVLAYITSGLTALTPVLKAVSEGPKPTVKANVGEVAS